MKGKKLPDNPSRRKKADAAADVLNALLTPFEVEEWYYKPPPGGFLQRSIAEQKDWEKRWAFDREKSAGFAKNASELEEVLEGTPKNGTDGWSELDPLALKARHQLAMLLGHAQRGDGAFLHLQMILTWVFTELEALAARGSEDAARTYLMSLHEAVERFSLLVGTEERAKVFKNFTARAFGVPLIFSPNSEKQADNERILQRLNVGSDHPLAIVSNGRGRRWKADDFINGLAMRLQSYIEYYRELFPVLSVGGNAGLPTWLMSARGLPEFSGSSHKLWASVAWEILKCSVPNGAIETHPALAAIGDSARSKKPKYCKTLHEKTQEGNARAKIKERLFRSFKLIA